MIKLPIMTNGLSKRKLMNFILPHRKRIHTFDRLQRDAPVYVRKENAIGRSFPTQTFTQTICIQRNQDQVILIGKILGNHFFDLVRCGKVDEAILEVDPNASKRTFEFRLLPSICRKHFV